MQGSYQVRVVGTDDKVSTKTVTLGDRLGSRRIVEHGLAAGERVVVEGAASRDGTFVHPVPFVPSEEGS